MDSINKNQPENNHVDLIGEEGIQKIKELINKATTCFFCTKINTNESFSARPMSVQKVDEDGNFWFLSATDSKKNLELAQNSSVQLLFQGSDYADFLNVYGTAEISQDKAVIKELWKPIAKVWFTEGEQDSRISVIKVIPDDCYYWDTKHNKAFGFMKMLIGVAMGKTLDDSIEGEIKI